MFEDKTYKRCTCKGPLTYKSGPDKGQPVLSADGTPKIGYLETACPVLKKRDHGSWYYSFELPTGPGGKRRRAKKGGYRTQKQAADAAKAVWEAAQDGIDVLSDENVADYLRRWIATRVALKRSTRLGYEDYIERIFIPAIGHIKLRDLRTRQIQEMFEAIWARNEQHAKNIDAARAALAAERTAREKWRQAAKPRPQELRQAWNKAKEALREARKKPRHITGAGTQLRVNNTLSAALDDAGKARLISQNWTKDVVLPTYRKPKPHVWTPERVEAWRKTGKKPGKVMVWTPEQTGQFLDAVAEHRLYLMFHLMVFRGVRRGETCGLPWAEVNLDAGVVHITEQLVALSYEVWEDTPKSDSGARTVSLDSQTLELLRLWKGRQQKERKEWEEHQQAKRRNGEQPKIWHDTGRVFTWEDGRAYHPEYLRQVFDRLLTKHGLPPIRLHDLRHCAATLSLAAGVHMKAIQTMLGHSSYQLTADTYTSVLPQFEKAQAEAPVQLVPRKTKARQPSGETSVPKKISDEAAA
ncbi:tyrosine-type recombinase/integrase [Streptomyces lunaelactis]|uniref:tyrosine-type recombinase/integrase n=1 Tax=Streptomyces lunaelactis TaxID=1535768 RepID=UPI001584C6E3|nr:tyrosine-type recombinase/integrase [Streptomyces lunaelactis]NUK32329.1 tyrosine-type recombinase/integrase [Streptomyces lunaelactis]